jgi:hypothetical protein
VWVSEKGDCANGHPRSSLRDEYEVCPQPTTALTAFPVGTSSAPQSLSLLVPAGAPDASALKRAVVDAKNSFSAAKQKSVACAAQVKASQVPLREATSRLDSLKSGKGAVLANLYNTAIVYEYWIQVPGYSGTVLGATSRMSQTGDVHQVSLVQSTSKSGVGGAVAGGLGGTLVGGPLIGAAGAILGNNMARKTKVNTTVSQVDTRQVELEVVGPGYAWSTAYAHDALDAVRQFKDLVNARGSAPQDIDTQTRSQEARVVELHDQMQRVVVLNDGAIEGLRGAQSRYQEALSEYAETARGFWDKIKILFTFAGGGKALPPAIRSTRLILVAGAVGLLLVSCSICGVLGLLTEPATPVSTAASVVGTATAESSAAVQPKPVPKPADVMLPAVAAWVKKYSEYGRPTTITTLPDWAGGKSQRLVLSGGLTLRFYLVEDIVNIVYEESAAGELIVFGHYAASFELPKPVERQATDGLPSYTVLAAAENITGEIAGNALVPSMTRSTSAAKRESVFRTIATREGLLTAAFYCTLEGYKADTSTSYRKAHPSALRKGFTGLLRSGKFTRGEKLYP